MPVSQTFRGCYAIYLSSYYYRDLQHLSLCIRPVSYTHLNGTNKITAEFASQMMHMHFNGITGDLFVPGIQLSLIHI